MPGRVEVSRVELDPQRTPVIVTGDAVDTVGLEGFEEVPEVAGSADTWWRGPDSLVTIYKGEAAESHIYFD